MFFSFPFHLQGEQLQYPDVPLLSNYSHFASVFSLINNKRQVNLESPLVTFAWRCHHAGNMWFSAEWESSVKISVIGELSHNWGLLAIWVYTHMPISPKYTHVHTLWALSFLVVFHLSMKCKTGQWLGSWEVDRAPYGGSWLHTTQQRAAMPNSQSEIYPFIYRQAKAGWGCLWGILCSPKQVGGVTFMTSVGWFSLRNIENPSATKPFREPWSKFCTARELVHGSPGWSWEGPCYFPPWRWNQLLEAEPACHS